MITAELMGNEPLGVTAVQLTPNKVLVQVKSERLLEYTRGRLEYLVRLIVEEDRSIPKNLFGTERLYQINQVFEEGSDLDQVAKGFVRDLAGIRKKADY